MRVIFMGTPDLAAVVLGALISSHHEVVSVFTQMPRPRGRGMRQADSPVASLAKKHDIKIYCPKSLRNAEVKSLIEEIEADVIVVAAYGMILPGYALSAKKYGAINVHPSLLPKFRGAAPMQHALLNMEDKTGICIMKMDAGLDTGDVLMREEFDIKNDLTYQELHDVSASIGAKLLLQTLDNIETIKPQPQDDRFASHAPKLSKSDGHLDWQLSAHRIDAMVRGMNPWPGVYFYHAGKRIKILASKIHKLDDGQKPGTVLSGAGFNVACGDGQLEILRLQIQGKKAMDAPQFLRGYKLPQGEVLPGKPG